MATNKKTKPLLSDEDMKPENISANITISMPLDLLNWYRSEAEKQGTKYQTLMKMVLTKNMFAQRALEARVEALEKVVGKKQA